MTNNIRRLEKLTETLGQEWVAMREEIYRLSQSMENFKAVIVSASDPIITASLDGTILTANPAALKLFGYEENTLLGQNLTVLMPERYRERHRAGLAHYKATGEGPIMGRPIGLHGLHGLLKSGEEIPIVLTVEGFQGDTGRWVSAAITIAKPDLAFKSEAGDAGG